MSRPSTGPPVTSNGRRPPRPTPWRRRNGEGNRALLFGSHLPSPFCGGEQLPFESDRFDCTVSTFTLCSIEDVSPALHEVYRVLKPGGRLLFLEHGLSPEPNAQKWQHRLNWLEIHLAAGCHLDRNIKELVAAQPFSSVAVEAFYLERTPRTHGYLYRGMAVK